MAGDIPLLCILVGCILLSGVADARLKRCQLSRLDRFPCRFKRKNMLPEANEYGIYQTRFRQGDNGIECRVQKDETILPISDLGSANLRLIFSPRFQYGELYANQILVNYSIQCPEGTIAFFNVTEQDLEEKCANECVDYLNVTRGQYGSSIICGNDTATNIMQLELGTFNVIFRTNEKRRFPGFEAYVVCFNQTDRDMPGCVNVSTGEPRRRRDVGAYGILPNQAEGAIIASLVAALTATLGPQDDFNISQLEPPTASFPPDYFVEPDIREKREMGGDESTSTRFIDDDTIRDAIRFEEACNPVLRTTSRIVIEVAGMDDPDRADQIRAESSG